MKRSRLRPVSRDAAKRKRDRSRKWGAAEFLAFCRARGCALARVWSWHVCEGPVAVCHLQSRGAGGGEFDSNGRCNLLPLCAGMHRRQEGRTDRFNAQNGIDLWHLAAEEKRAWEATR